MLKDRKNIIKIILVLMLSVLVPILIEKFYFDLQPFSVDRFIIYFVIMLFMGIHFIFKVKDIWNQVYKKRYLIGIVIFAFLVIGGYHGSSVGIYNGAIQGSIPVENGNPILGENRVIRGDEYAVSTPFVLSQVSPANELSSTNHNLMAQDKSVSFYLRYPTFDSASFSVPQQLGFLVLPVENAFSMYWYLPIFFMFFATFEFLMILTKQNKLWSGMGALMITFAPATQWWYAYMIIASGEAALVVFNAFLKSKNLKQKIIFSALIGYFGSIYIMNMYPAWLIPYGYFFLVIVCWLIFTYRTSIKLKDILLLIVIAVFVIAITLVPAFLNGKETYDLITNTVYPGARLTTGGDGQIDIIKYFSNLFLPMKIVNNACEMSQFISFYPLPTIMGIYYGFKNYKNKNNDFLLNGLVILSILLSIWNFLPIPEIIAKITLISMSTVSRANITLGYINVIILIICLSKYTHYTQKNKVIIGVGTVISGTFIVYSIKQLTPIYPEYFSTKVTILSILLFLFIFMAIIVNNHKLNKMLALVFIPIIFVSGVMVQPLNKGLNVFYDKPVVKEVEKIIAKDKTARWMCVSTPYYIQNYIAATGAYMINSTNYYPNFELWNRLDPEKEFDNVYNRYGHLSINLSLQKTDIKLISNDHVGLDLNVDQVKDIDINYIISVSDLSEYSNDMISFEKEYYEDGLYIYRVMY
ncbi:hypothetical protein PM724_16735 [Erysipelatoclostridium ramosum]|uniref:DUF7657 domain-containing protein n=1 Tax=Thomasclavelia ramosa TaxID=1547 RepID=UPI0018AC5CC5|nr:hypothetical protein [Thomasclavelia ramosa]MDB7095567.1 hypothetical protein [Thomasclavelia ramosa]